MNQPFSTKIFIRTILELLATSTLLYIRPEKGSGKPSLKKHCYDDSAISYHQFVMKERQS